MQLLDALLLLLLLHLKSALPIASSPVCLPQIFAGVDGVLGGRASDERLFVRPGLEHEVSPGDPAAGEHTHVWYSTHTENQHAVAAAAVVVIACEETASR